MAAETHLRHLRGGTIIDGTGGSAFPSDVLIRDQRIEAVGTFDSPPDAEVIEASGCYVTPGFIDIHSHSDFTLLADPRAVSSVTQGVTLEVVGNCGWGCAVIGDRATAPEVIYGFRRSPAIHWSDTAGYLEALDHAGPAVNVAVLVPNGQLRLATVGMEARAATDDERARMKTMLRDCLEQGAFGYSTGLEYASENGAPEDEIADLCRVVADAGGIYATHTRNRDEAAVEAVGEAIRTAEQAGVRLQISHITPRRGLEDTAKAIELVDRARTRGSDVAFDMHTRLFGTTYLKVLLPMWAFGGGAKELVRRLSDPDARARMKQHRNPISSVEDWSRVVLLDNPAFPQFSRRSLADIGAEIGISPLDSAYDILRAEADAGQILRQMVILHTYDEETLAFTYSHACCGVGSDATALAPDGPLAGSAFHGAYTWASWFYRRMVRETGRFTPEEGIRKLSALAAERMGLSGRGVIRKGAYADVAIFEPDRFGETGTTFEPSKVAVGMRHVLVNGVVTLKDGALTGRSGGMVLRHRA